MAERYCFIGLGNPGKGYERTRHNIGFEWIDAVARSIDSSPQFSNKFESKWWQVRVGDVEAHFLKPQTYMNLSGKAYSAWKKRHQGEHRLLVVIDEIDLHLGSLRLRKSGSDGGHRGLRSMIEHAQTKELARLRIGVGRPVGDETSDHVLEKFHPDEWSSMQEVLQVAPKHFQCLLEADVLDKAMNVINAWRNPAQKESDE